MALQEFVIQFKTRKNLRLTLQNARLFLALQKVKTFFAVVVLEFDDSCYVDAKQYRLASFSTRNSTLNTSLR